MLKQKNKVGNGVLPNFSQPQNLKRKLLPDTEREFSRKVQKHSSLANPKQSKINYI